jgi:hypothetical protein
MFYTNRCSPVKNRYAVSLIRSSRSVTTMRVEGGDYMELALLAVAVVLMLGGAVMLVGGWIASGIAIPVIAVGIALVAIERRHRATHA